MGQAQLGAGTPARGRVGRCEVGGEGDAVREQRHPVGAFAARERALERTRRDLLHLIAPRERLRGRPAVVEEQPPTRTGAAAPVPERVAKIEIREIDEIRLPGEQRRQEPDEERPLLHEVRIAAQQHAEPSGRDRTPRQVGHHALAGDLPVATAGEHRERERRLAGERLRAVACEGLEPTPLVPEPRAGEEDAERCAHGQPRRIRRAQPPAARVRSTAGCRSSARAKPARAAAASPASANCAAPVMIACALSSRIR